MYNTIAIFTPSVSYAVSICFSLPLSPSFLTPQNQMCQVCPQKMSYLPTTSSTLDWTSVNGSWGMPRRWSASDSSQHSR